MHLRVIITASIMTTITLAGCTAPQHHPAFTYDHNAVIRADRTQPCLALIFTGGDHGQATNRILDILANHGIRASFFLTGGYLANPAQRSCVARMLAAGHYVGPHSDAHLLYCAWEDRTHTLVTRREFTTDLRNNIADLRALGCLAEAGPRQPDPVYFIPPYEWYNCDQVRWARAMNVRLFNFTPGSGSNRDWIPEGQPGFVPSAEIIADVLAYERRDPTGLNGFLLLFHLGSQRTDLMDAELDNLLTELRNRGYTFARVDDLLGPASKG